jgi:PleD family two-component response regulator
MSNPKKSGYVLIVDDQPNNLRLLSTTLTEAGYRVRNAISGKMALMGIEKALPQLILLDIMMPQMDGYELCQHLKSDERTQHIPVIFLSALDNEWDKVKAFDVGGSDYITKPFQVKEVLSRVNNTSLT